MALFALADTHLSLVSGKPMDVFGSRWKNYLSKLTEGWNSTVGSDDTVCVCGDISWAMTTEEAAEDLRYLDSLNGRKIISRGNHDYWWPSMSKLNTFFSENGITTVDALHNNAFIRDGITVCGTRGWYNDGKNAPPETEYKKIVDREAGRLRLSLDAGRRLGADGETVVFLHFPPVFGGFVCRELVAVLHEYSVKRCVYGHIHGMYELEASNEFEGISFIPASADYLNFVPLRISSS